MVRLEQLQAVLAAHGLEGLSAWLQPLEAALPHLPAVSLSSAEATALQHGQAVPLAAAEIETGSLVRVFDAEQRLLGLGELREHSILVAKRLLNR
jgi:tRNA pseudouridine55 synthase